MEQLPQSRAEQDANYNALGVIARIGTVLPFPIKAEAEQPSQEEMKRFIAANGYRIMQQAPPPYTHVIAVNAHQEEPTPLVYFLAELRGTGA